MTFFKSQHARPHTRLRTRILGAALWVSLLTACGGGGGGGTAATGAESWGLDFIGFEAGAGSLDLSTGSTATAFSPSWQARRTGGNPAYWVRVHLVPANTPNAALSDNTAILGANCGPNVTGCDTSGAQVCTYTTGAQNGTRRIDCGDVRGMARSRDRAPGAYLLVGQLCYSAVNLVDVCAQAPAVPITLR